MANRAEVDDIGEGGGLVDKRAKVESTPRAKWNDIRQLFMNRMMVGIFLGQFCINAITYFFITWFPVYLVQVRGMSILKVGFVAALPAICGFSDTVEAAGLVRIGRVRLLDPPLAVPGSALSEMGGGASRARTLRRVASISLFALPLGLSLLQLLTLGSTALAYAAALAATAGVSLEHWLFFAETRHMSSAWFDAGRHVLR